MSIDTNSVIKVEHIGELIIFVRGQKVILDSLLANMYGVQTKSLLRAVRRNMERFPEDFMFQLTEVETEDLRCHNGTSMARGGRRYLPYVFTEQGVAMLSSVLRSPRAIKVNIEIMRAFVRLRQILLSHADLARKIDRLEKKYDAQFRVIFDAIRDLVTPPRAEKRSIGFRD